MKTYKSLCLLLIAGCVLATCSVLAQSKKTIPEMVLFRGGDLNFSVDLGLSVWGGGTGSGTAGGVISPAMQNGAASLFFNPAELALLTKPQVVFDTRLGLGTQTLGLQGSDIAGKNMIKDQTDTFLNDTTSFKYTGAGKTYTAVQAGQVSQVGQFSSFALATPVLKDWVVGIAYSYPVFTGISMRDNGIDVRIRSSENVGGNQTTFDMLLDANIAMDAALRMNLLMLGFGGKVHSGRFGELLLGASVNRYDVENVLNVNMAIDGSMTLNRTQTYYFNTTDPNLNSAAGETNDFYWKVQGRYRDVKYGATVGLYYNTTPFSETLSFLNFSLVYDLKPKFVLTDDKAVNIGYQPKFFSGSPLGKGDEGLQLLIDSLNLSKPNLTTRTVNPFADHVGLSLPSSLTLGIDAKLGLHTVAMNVVKYFGDLRYEYASYEFGKTPSLGLKFGVDFKFPEELKGWSYALLPVRLLFLDFDGIAFQIFRGQTGYTNNHYRLGGGVMLGDGIAEGFSQTSIQSTRDAFGTPFPTGFSLGRQYTIYDRLTIGVMVFGIPDLATRLSVGYQL